MSVLSISRRWLRMDGLVDGWMANVVSPVASGGRNGFIPKRLRLAGLERQRRAQVSRS